MPGGGDALGGVSQQRLLGVVEALMDRLHELLEIPVHALGAELLDREPRALDLLSEPGDDRAPEPEDMSAVLAAVYRYELRRSRRGGGAPICRKLCEGDVDFVAHRGDDRRFRLGYRPDDGFV